MTKLLKQMQYKCCGVKKRLKKKKRGLSEQAYSFLLQSQPKTGQGLMSLM